MRKSTKSTRKVSMFLAVLFTVAAGIFLVQIGLRRNLNVDQISATPTNTPEVSFILDIPQKALWRNYVHVSAEAAPGTTCDLLYIPPSGDSQELSTVADENGRCTWRWKIEETDGKGNGRLIFTIDGRSETHFIEIRRSF